MSDTTTARTNRTNAYNFDGFETTVNLIAPVTGEQFDQLVKKVAEIVNSDLYREIGMLKQQPVNRMFANDHTKTSTQRTYHTPQGELQITVAVKVRRAVDFMELTVALDIALMHCTELVRLLVEHNSTFLAAMYEARKAHPVRQQTGNPFDHAPRGFSVGDDSPVRQATISDEQPRFSNARTIPGLHVPRTQDDARDLRYPAAADFGRNQRRG